MRIPFYRTLPLSLQKLVRGFASLLPFSYRMGREYRSMKEFLQNASGWNEERIAQWQFESLQHILRYAYEHVAGYQQLFREQRITPQDIRSLEDVAHLPFVTKELLRDNLTDFSSQALPEWKRLYRTTGGSTAIPFGFYLTQEDIERELAFLHEAWEVVGWHPGDRSAILRGAFIGSEEDFWEHDPLFNSLSLSTYHLSERTYKQYRQKLLEARPLHLQAYPSAAMILADLVRTHGDRGRFPFRLLLLGSENLYRWQKDLIRAAFPGSRIYSWYGHAEQVLFAPQCSSSELYHLHPFYGYAEILNAAGTPVAEGESGELVGTSLWNLVTPFIRYRTMDRATRGPRRCPHCGAAFPVLDRIEGRLQEFIVSRNDRYISMTQINMHSGVFDNVRQFQFCQKEKGTVVMRIVRKNGYTDQDTHRITEEVRKKLGDDLTLSIEFVDHIAPLPSGKFSFLRQELALKYGDHANRP